MIILDNIHISPTILWCVFWSLVFTGIRDLILVFTATRDSVTVHTNFLVIKTSGIFIGLMLLPGGVLSFVAHFIPQPIYNDKDNIKLNSGFSHDYCTLRW